MLLPLTKSGFVQFCFFLTTTGLSLAARHDSVKENNDLTEGTKNPVNSPDDRGLELALPTAAVLWTPSKPKELSPDDSGTCNDEYTCLYVSVLESERPALEALRALHRQLDDDANGNIDLSESEEFLREELHYENGNERRQKNFHRNDDTHISVRELWESWIKSEVYNWTVEQTVDWLVNFIDLPQYAQLFIQNEINGTKLPRMAVSNTTYFSKIGIKDAIHRQKIALKAMDVVLFGPPRDVSYSHTKDVALIALLLIALTGCWYAYNSKRKSQLHLSKLMRHLESLSSAEKELQELQAKFAQKEQDLAMSRQEQLNKQYEEDVKQDSDSGVVLVDTELEKELARLRNEVEVLRSELQRAEGELEDRCWLPPAELQHWLQLTYELEQRAYNKKKQLAEVQLEQAKEACDRLRKKRSSFVGAFVSTHGRAIDDVDRSILEARNALLEVKQDLQERTIRWKQIEMLSNFQVTTNPGLAYLETLLRTGAASRCLVYPRSGLSFDDDDENSSVRSAGNNGSSHSISGQQQHERPRSSSNVSRSTRALPPRENSKDSGSEVTSHNPAEDESIGQLKNSSTLVRNTTNHKLDALKTDPMMGSPPKSDPPTAQEPAPLTTVELVEPSGANGTSGTSLPAKLVSTSSVGSIGSSKSTLLAPAPELVLSKESAKKSPALSTKFGFRTKNAMEKSYSQDAESIVPKKPVLRKVSHSETDLKSSFQVESIEYSKSSESSVSSQTEDKSSASAISTKARKKIFIFSSFARRKKKTAAPTS